MLLQNGEYGLFWQPLGGNNTDQISGHCYRYTLLTPEESTTIFVDLGKFDNHQALGIQGSRAAVPDIIRFLESSQPPLALLLTHSHPDHLNGIVHYLRAGFHLPLLYGGKYTKIILDDLCDEFQLPLDRRPDFKIIQCGDVLHFGQMEIEVLSSSHTCFDTFGFVIKTPYATIYHTGDMKLDASTCFRKPTDVKRLRQRAREINWAVVDFYGVTEDGYAVTERENLLCLYELLAKYPQRKSFIPVYPTHQEMYILAFLAALKMKKDVIFYGNRDFYSYLQILKNYGIDFFQLAKNRIKVYIYPHVDFKHLCKNFAVIGTFNDLPEIFSAQKNDSFALITARSYFNPLKEILKDKGIPFAGIDKYPALQGCGHGFLKDCEALSKILPNTGFIPTHCPVFVIDNFRPLADFLSIRLIKHTPHNGEIYHICQEKAFLAGKDEAHWLVVTDEKKELLPVRQKATSGLGFLKRTISRRRCFNKFREYLHQRRTKGGLNGKI